MRFWFVPSSDVPLREQVVAQVTLGILCGELAPGERLPSIRELGRRFGIHANTISAGYRQLEDEGWVESRRGSGVYVKAADRTRRSPASAQASLDRLVANLFESGRRLGLAPAAIVEGVTNWRARQPIERLLVIEPDEELRRIVLAELTRCTSIPVEGRALAGLTDAAEHALLVALPSKLEAVRAAAGTARVAGLRVRSIPASMAEYLPASLVDRSGMLIGIASRWPEFLRFARTMIIAAGFDADALLIRDARLEGWSTGLKAAAAVVCDAVTEQHLTGHRTIPFYILAENIAETLEALLNQPT